MKNRKVIHATEQGYMLGVLMFAVAMIMITLALAAPRLARSIQRDRELETVHRANQYVRAVQLYYRKFGTYPSSIDQLMNTNKIRFLRQKYADPMTGKDNWKLIHLGQNKTQTTGFFGKPLTGIGTAGGGMGGASSIGSNTASTFGTDSNSASTNSTTANGATSPNGAAGLAGTGTDSSNGSTTLGPGISSQSATTFSGGGGGPIIGVSSVAEGESMISIHEKDHYKDWEFFYDPRLDQLKAAAAATNGPGSVGSNTTSNFGNSVFGSNGANGANGTTGAPGSTSINGTPATPTTPQQ